MARHYYSITAEVEVSLDGFALEDIAEYLAENGYHVSKDEEDSDITRYPQGIKDPQKYRDEFCKLNGLALK